MKCEYCNGTLSLEDEYCPHCGQPNQHARKHIDDMRRYQGEFEDTKKYVHDKTAGYMEITVRVVIMSVLIVLIIGFFAAGSNAWEILWQMKKSDGKKNFEEYSQILDGYLENEDYLAFDAFCSVKGIYSYDSPYRERYHNIIAACGYYEEAYRGLLEFAGFDERNSVSQISEATGNSLDNFYQYYLNEDFLYTGGEPEPEDFRRILDNMERDIELILVTYCGFTEEEAASFPKLSKAKRNVILEEKLEAGLQDEQ